MTPAVCLAIVLYYEARTEELNGQIAVAWVVRNSAQTLRVRPISICKEAFSGRYMGVETYYEGKLPKGKTWKHLLGLSRDVLKGYIPDITKGAVYFECTKWRACNKHPEWEDYTEFAGQFGTQKFWRKPS